MVKLDLGSGPRDFWVSDESDWLHLDCEPYEGVIQWTCPEPIPVKDRSVEVAYLGQLLVELSIEQQLALADELVRVMKDDGVIRVHDYDGVLGYPEFFRRLEQHGWRRVKEELVNVFEEPDGTILCTYMVELKKIRWCRVVIKF